MPTDAEHAQKHRENRQLLDGPPALTAASPVWASVVAFYAALHLVERLAAKEGLNHTSHGARKVYLAAHPQHRAILLKYMSLQTASLTARYDSPRAFSEAYTGAAVQNVLIGHCLAAIEAHVAAHT